MLAAFSGSGGVKLRKVPIPEPDKGEALVRIKAVGICETDVKITLHGESPPRILGHEWSGTLERSPPGLTMKEGSRVVGEGMVGCGVCTYCRGSRPNLCASYREIGFTLPGAYAEYLAIPATNLHPLPDPVGFEQGTLVEPTAVALHALDLGGVVEGCDVAVVGPGPIGLLTVQLAKVLGAERVFLTGTRRNRLDLGRQLGAERVLDINEEDPVAKIAEETGGGPDLVVDAAGTPSSFAQSVGMVAKGGTVVMVGGWEEVRWRPGLMIGKEITLKGSLASPGAWGRSLDLISRGRISTEPLITHRFGLPEIAEAFDLVDAKKDGVIKAVVLP